MGTSFNILPVTLLDTFVKSIDFAPLKHLKKKTQEDLPVDYFNFYNAVSSVYSSKIEGEEVDFDSFFKHKFLNVSYKPDYTQRSDDLYRAYEYIQSNPLTFPNILKAHTILSEHLLPESQRGVIRNNPMFVINDEDRIEYVACEPIAVHEEIKKLFGDVDTLMNMNLGSLEVFFYASLLHLVFVKIHPLQDGNGRTARLLEKWFLLEKLGKEAVAVELEKHYYLNRKQYYHNIRLLGLEYERLNYDKAMSFLKMTVESLRETEKP